MANTSLTAGAIVGKSNGSGGRGSDLSSAIKKTARRDSPSTMLDSTKKNAATGSPKGASQGSINDTPLKKKRKSAQDNKWQRRLGFAGLCLAVVMSSAVFSLLAPFYPDVAANNGLSEGTVGFIFAIFALMVMLVSPYLGVKMGEIGSRKMMIYGLALLSVSTVAFSVLDSIDPVHSTIFLVVSVLLRILQGIGAAGSETASYALAAQLYPDDLSYAVGVMETMYGQALCGFGCLLAFGCEVSVVLAIAVLWVVVLTLFSRHCCLSLKKSGVLSGT